MLEAKARPEPDILDQSRQILKENWTRRVNISSNELFYICSTSFQ